MSSALAVASDVAERYSSWVCLLAVLFQVHPDAALIVAANRDELSARPAAAMTVLRASAPRILGGRDEIAGGTWMATNEHGVVAALTNVPAQRDATRRSRGELPLLLTAHESAQAAAEAFEAEVDPADYSPCWILVGDPTSLHYIDVSQADGAPPLARRLEPGVHVLENHPLQPRSDKARAVAAALGAMSNLSGAALIEGLARVLADHHRPEGAPPHRAACVHGDGYGTRSSSLALARPGPSPPRVFFADGPPCKVELREATARWTS